MTIKPTPAATTLIFAEVLFYGSEYSTRLVLPLNGHIPCSSNVKIITELHEFAGIDAECGDSEIAFYAAKNELNIFLNTAIDLAQYGNEDKTQRDIIGMIASDGWVTEDDWNDENYFEGVTLVNGKIVPRAPLS